MSYFSPKYPMHSCNLLPCEDGLYVNTIHRPFLDTLPLRVVMAAIHLLACLTQGFGLHFMKRGDIS
jgi:hypothetical protein